MKVRFLPLLFLIPTMIICSFAVSARADDSYIDIYTKADLIDVQKNLSGNYRLMNDLTFTEADFQNGGICYNGGQGFLPIGTGESKAFSGIFDGGGHTIHGLTFDRKTSYAGLFGYNIGTVQNVTVEACEMISTVSSYDLVYVGGIAGYNTGEIINCRVTGKLSSISGSNFNNAYVGGIVGYCKKGSIRDCNTSCTLVATTTSFTPYHDFFAGGIVGYAVDSTVSACFATGDPYADRVGGVIGAAVGCTVESCWNSGTIVSRESESSYVGGILGKGERCTVRDCYNVGAVTAKAASRAVAGGIVGEQNGGTIKTCYNLALISATGGSVSKQVSVGGIVGLRSTGVVADCCYADLLSQKDDDGNACSDEQLKQAGTYQGFDFQTVWTLQNGRYAYPQLRSCAMTAAFNGPTAVATTTTTTMTTTRPMSATRTTATTTAQEQTTVTSQTHAVTTTESLAEMTTTESKPSHTTSTVVTTTDSNRSMPPFSAWPIVWIGCVVIAFAGILLAIFTVKRK